jgi:hypothetical protein
MADDATGEHVQVAEAAQAYEAELIALRLRANGIDAHVVDQTFHAEPLPSVRSFAVVRVMVPASQAEQARRILAEARPLPEDVDPDGGGNPEVM